jgi:hypothetical protein
MKKFLFLGLAAMMAFTSCTKDETLATAQNGAIGFDVAADKATRSVDDPSITTETIQDFAVYGFMENATGVLFRDELVSRNGNAWSYTNTQYWVPEKNFYFAALAPSNGRNWELTNEAAGDNAFLGVGTVKFTNEAGKQDLLYWAQGPIVGQDKDNAAVPVLFNHLLSKVKFSFVNEFDNEKVTLKVSNIVINELEKVANINLATSDWWTNKDAWTLDGTEKVDFNFGAASATAETTADAIAQYAEMESYNQLLVFPHSKREYYVTFTIDMYMGGFHAGTYAHDINVPVEFEMGKAYDLKATINAGNIIDPDDPNHKGETVEPIEFTVEVKPWDEAGEVEMPGLTPAEDALMAAIEAAADGATVQLSSDVTLTNALVINKNITIDLNGKNLTGGLFAESNGAMNEGNTDSYVFWVKEGAKLTITGEGNVVSQAAAYSMAVWAQGGEVIINGGNFYNAGKGSDLIYASAGGKVTVNGGKFVACEKQAGVEGTNEERSALNAKDKDYVAGQTFVVKGGTYFHFDPANNTSEGVGTNFVADGYKSVYDDTTGYYTVSAK